MQRSFLIFLFTIIATTTFAQNNVTTYKERRDTFPNGQTHIQWSLRTKVSGTEQLHEFRVHKEFRFARYDSTGILRERSHRIYKDGTWGKPCNEILFEREVYDAAGNLVQREKSKCDCRKTVKKYYHNGKLMRVERIRLRRPENDGDDRKKKNTGADTGKSSGDEGSRQ